MRSIKHWGQFIKFACVAAIYNLTAYLLFAGLVVLNCNYLIASGLSFIFGVSLSYYMNKSFVFSSTEHNYKIIITFFSYYFMLLLTCICAMYYFTAHIKINPYFSQIIVSLIAALVSYYTMRWLFSSPTKL